MLYHDNNHHIVTTVIGVQPDVGPGHTHAEASASPPRGYAQSLH